MAEHRPRTFSEVIFAEYVADEDLLQQMHIFHAACKVFHHFLLPLLRPFLRLLDLLVQCSREELLMRYLRRNLGFY